jgi:hypothetical protein
MSTVDNFFSAVPDQNRLMAFANKSEGTANFPSTDSVWLDMAAPAAWWGVAGPP